MKRIYVHFSSKDRQSIVPVVQHLRTDGHQIVSKVSLKEMPDACLWFVSKSLPANEIPDVIRQLDLRGVLVIPILLGHTQVNQDSTPTRWSYRAIPYRTSADYSAIEQTLQTILPSSELLVPHHTVPQRRNRAASTAALVAMAIGLMACLLILLLNRSAQPLLQEATPTVVFVQVTTDSSWIVLVPSPQATHILTSTTLPSITPSLSLSPSALPLSTTPIASATITDTAIPKTLTTPSVPIGTPFEAGGTHNTTGIISLILFPGGCPIITSITLTQLTPIGRSADSLYVQFNAPGYFGAWTYAGNVLGVDLGSLPITLPPFAFLQSICAPTPIPGNGTGGGPGNGTGDGASNENGGVVSTPLPPRITENGVTMALVISGCFQMGNDREASYFTLENTVIYGAGGGGPGVPDGGNQCLNSFYMDIYEVNQQQFDALGGSARLAPAFPRAERPRENITWFEASAYCASRGARLPTESEWEYAARGANNLGYPWGNTWDGNNLVWKVNSGGQTANVGSYPAGASWAGIYDLLGNVEEWTSSAYQLNYPYLSSVSDQPARDNNTKMSVRGSSFTAGSQYPRSADRSWYVAGSATQRVGFRCVRSV